MHLCDSRIRSRGFEITAFMAIKRAANHCYKSQFLL
jgi:hypothetical protein